MRDPRWNRCKEVCRVLISRQDADELDLKDGEDNWVITEASRVVLPVEISTLAVKGVLVIPHGFGLIYQGEANGVNINVLSKNTHRDRMTATPLHRYIPCKIERA